MKQTRCLSSHFLFPIEQSLFSPFILQHRQMHVENPRLTTSSPNPTAKMSLSIQDRSPLHNTKTSIPNLGLGVYQLYGQACQKAVLAALESGYRHIDSAQLYRNESDVGAAVQQSGVKRQDVFLTTKIRQSAGGFDKSYQSVVESIEKVGGKNGYVDLFLIHVPGTGRETREELWKVLEKVYGEGRAKAIGVSNYRPQHIDEMKEYANIWPPHVNQVEVCARRGRALLSPSTPPPVICRRCLAVPIWLTCSSLLPAPSVVPAAGHRAILQGQQHCRGGVQPSVVR